MRDAVDAAWADVSVDALVQNGLDVLRYTGPARPTKAWVDECVAKGVLVTFIQESTSTRSQDGYEAGAADCQFAEGRAREVHPGVASIAVVVSDGNGADRWDCSEYGRGWASVATLPFFPYGALGVTASFLAGAKGSPHSIDGEWVPITWGPARLISQLVTASPLPNTDLNTVHADYTGGTSLPTAPGAIFQEDAMAVIKEVRDDGGKPQWWLPSGGGLVQLSDGEAYAWIVVGKIPVVEYPTLGVVGLAARMAEANNLPWPPPK